MEELRFTGNRGGHAPMTWGQGEQWETILANRPHERRSNMTLLTELPPATPPHRALAALTALIQRHESLRTAFTSDDGRPPIQVVRDSGSLPIDVITARTGSGLSEARQFVERVASLGFDVGPDPHIRLGLVLHGGHARWIGGALSHLVHDYTSRQILSRDFQTLLTAASTASGVSALAPVTHQPLDRAAEERSPAGQDRLETVVRRWRTGFDQCPRSLCATPVARPEGPRFPAVELRAKGLGQRAQVIADRLNVGVSAVFLGAAAAALAQVSDVDRFGMILTCSNRGDPRTRNYVGSLAQQGMITVPSLGDSPHALIRRMWPSLLLTHRTSGYDLGRLDAAFPEVTEEFGTSIDHFVNVMAADEPLRPARFAEGLGEGEAACEVVTPVDSTRLRFGLFLESDGRDAHGRMFGNHRYVTTDLMRAVLTGVREFILAAEGDEVTRSG